LPTVVEWLGTLSTPVAGIVVIGGFVLISVVIGHLVARFAPQEILSAYNDRTGVILGVMGVMYAVLLAFVAVGAWERFEQAEARTYEEANALTTAYRDAGSFAGHGPVREMLRAYVHSVIDKEWPHMRSDEKASLYDPQLEAADRAVRALPVTSPRLQVIDAEMLAAMDKALMDRESRLTLDSTGINGVMWVVLILGAFLTVAFTYLFGFEKHVMQVLMVGGLSLMIGLVLFLAVSLDYPFRGSIAVGPDAFRAALETFKSFGP
jgi:hypothetical protein